MADLTAANVSVDQPVVIDRSMDKYLRTFPKITFGNGALTYPAGGIPLPDKSNFGLNFECLRAYVEQPANGLIYHIDRTNWKLRIFKSAGFTPAGTVSAPLMNIAGDHAGAVAIGIDPDADGGALCKTSAGNKTGITGIQAPTFTGIAVAAAALAEFSGAVALTTLYLEMVGR